MVAPASPQIRHTMRSEMLDRDKNIMGKVRIKAYPINE